MKLKSLKNQKSYPKIKGLKIYIIKNWKIEKLKKKVFERFIKK